MVSAPARGVPPSFKICAVVKKGIIPLAGIFPVERFFDEGQNVRIADFASALKEEVDKHRADIRLDDHTWNILRENHDVARSRGTHTGESAKRFVVLRKLALKVFLDPLGGTLQKHRPAVVAEALPFEEEILLLR